MLLSTLLVCICVDCRKERHILVEIATHSALKNIQCFDVLLKRFKYSKNENENKNEEEEQQ